MGKARGTIAVGLIVTATLASVATWGQGPTKEYIRLGGRVIAIESSPGGQPPVVAPPSESAPAGATRQFRVTGPSGIGTITWSVESGGGTFDRTTSVVNEFVTYSAPPTVPSATNAVLKACAGATNCQTVNVSLTPGSGLSISRVGTTSVSKNAGGVATFTAQITGGTSKVVWSLASLADGILSAGGVNGATAETDSGLPVTYTAPVSVASDRTVSVTACVKSSPAVCAAPFTVDLKALTVTVTVTPASVRKGDPVTIGATVGNLQPDATSRAVTLSLGTATTTLEANAAGVVTWATTAPATSGVYTIRAVPSQDPNVSGSALLDVTELVAMTWSASVTGVTADTANIVATVSAPA